MTGLLQKPFAVWRRYPETSKTPSLPRSLKPLDDDQQNVTPLETMARQALEEHRRGETRPLDELIG
jgi:hypothetical protein